MGSKISTADLESDCKKLMAGKKRTKTESESTINILSCCMITTTSPPLSLVETPDHVNGDNNIKRSRRSLFRTCQPSQKSNLSLSNKVSPRIIRCRKTAEKGSFLAAFFRLFDDDMIQDFLWMDSCFKLADKYLLAMIYTYFRRANMNRREYNRTNFFAALYLAHDMEEDNEDLKLEIYPWALGEQWREKYFDFINQRDIILKRMDYRAAVSEQTTNEVISLCPMHPIWKRDRKQHHGGAERVNPFEEDEEFSPRGPNSSPLYCALCDAFESTISNESTSTFTSGYFSSNELISPLSSSLLTKQESSIKPDKKSRQLSTSRGVLIESRDVTDESRGVTASCFKFEE